MKRVLILSTLVIALFGLLVAPATVFAGPNCGSKSAGVKTSAQCSSKDAAACASKMGMSPEECAKLCASGDFTMVSLSVAGMTGACCENLVSGALKGLDGVVKVGAVDFKSGNAYAMVDLSKTSNETIVAAVSKTGYQASIVPAVLTTSTSTDVTAQTAQVTTTSGHACSPAVQAACASKGKTACAKSCASKKTDKKAEGSN